MSDKVFVGQRAATLSVPPAFDPISKIIILVDSENVYEAGDDTGLTLEVTCPYGTQTLADNLLARYKGFTYQPLEAGDALMDPSAELGDGVTIAGVYAMLAEQELEFDSHLASKVTAPGKQELESEYPFQTEVQQLERKIARTRSYIKKSNEEIKLLIQEEVNGLQGAFSDLELTLDGLTTRVQDAEGNLAELELTTQEFGVSIEGLENDFTELRLDLDGLTVTDEEGTTKIKGSSIETDTLYVKSANITGTITATALSVKDASGNNLLNAGGNAVKIATWNVDNNSLYSGDTFDASDVYLCTGSVGYTSIGGSPALQNWVFKAGSYFGVQKDGTAYMSNAILQGTVTANYGKIGPWTVGDVTLYNTVGSVMYSGKALYATDTTVNYTVYLTPRYLYLLYGDARTPMAARWSKIITMAGDEA